MNGIVTYGETVLSRTEKRSCHVRRNGRVTWYMLYNIVETIPITTTQNA